VPAICKKDRLFRALQSLPFKTNVVAVLVSSLHHLFSLQPLVGLGDLDTTGGTKSLLDVAVDGELTSGQGTDHEETGTDTAVRATETELLGDLDQTAGGTLTRLTLGLVDLGEHGVGGLGDKSGGETGDETGRQVVNGLHGVGGLALVDDGVDSLVDLLEDDELGHGVRDPVNVLAGTKTETVWSDVLLEQDGTETRVESTNTLSAEDLAETTNQTVGELGVGNETDTGGLKGAESDISDELGATGGTEVDGSAVVGGGLVAESVDSLLLEELVSTELEGTLEEVTSGGRTETSPDGASTLVSDDLAETTDQAGVVGDGVKLDPGLDATRLLAV
jgi:hypothetical protein